MRVDKGVLAMIDLGLAPVVRRRAEASREEARRCRAVAREQREASIWLKWRARKVFFDSHGAVLAMWSGEEYDALDDRSVPDGRGPVRRWHERGRAVTAVTSRRDAAVLVPDTAVRHLFRISVELAGVLELSRDPEVARRIRQIMTDADELIHEFRVDPPEGSVEASDADAPGGDPGAVPSDAASEPPPDQRLAMRLLQEASHAIDRSLTFTRRQSERAALNLEVDLEEASWAVHRAIIALTG